MTCRSRGWASSTDRGGTRRFVAPPVGLQFLLTAALLAVVSAVVSLFPPELLGTPVPAASQAEAAPKDYSRVGQGDSCDPWSKDFQEVLRSVRVSADDGRPDAAAALLEGALRHCPDHPELLLDLAGVRVLQGDLVEAEALATRLVRIRPGLNPAWELLSLTRYLQDDALGALRAWSRVGRPVIQDLDIRVLGHNGPRASGSGPHLNRVSGITEGRRLTVDDLTRGERRLGALPAADRARLGYRMLPGGKATVEGTVVLGTDNPFTRPELVVHALRLLGRQVHLVSTDPLDRLERWELSGTMEGTLHRARLALAHPAPGSAGIWRWEVDHQTGRYGSKGSTDAVRETRSSLGWSHTDWVTATLRGRVHGQVDVRPERGTFVGAGASWTLLPRAERGALGAEATGWFRTGERGAAPTGHGPEPEARFGRAEIRGLFHAIRPRESGARALQDGRGVGRGVSGLGVDLRGGVVAVSRGIPPDLLPRIGSGGNAALLMRARSDLDHQGVIRPLLPGTAWAHGGVEVVRSVGALGPVGIGLALFADGMRVLSPEGGADLADGRRGAVHLGGGLRARIPWVDGWLRTDWGIDPHDGTSTFSAAWVREHRLHRLSAH